MKKTLFVLFVLIFNHIHGQNSSLIKGTVIKNYGATYKIEGSDLLLDTTNIHKVIFDIANTPKKKNKLNPLINTIARFINMHAHQGVPLKSMEIVAVFHGGATKDILKDTAYHKKHKVKNPNSEILNELKKAGVKIFVCGQSYTHRGYNENDISSNTKMALSAMTALVYFQGEGYQLINFN